MDLGDAFCIAFDEQAKEPLGNLDWLHKAKVKAAINAVKREAFAGTFSLDPPPPPDWSKSAWRMVQLKAIDEVFGEVGAPGIVSARSGRPEGRAEPVIAEQLVQRYEGTGRFNDEAPGGLLPKRANALRTGALPDRLQDAFSFLVRVPEEVWQQIDFVPLSAGHEDFSRLHLVEGLSITCVAFLEDADDIVLERRDRNGTTVFSVRPRDGEKLRSRVRRVLASLDASDTHIGVLPESAASPDLLSVWREAIRAGDRPASPLRWLLIGSGHFKAGVPPDNTAVLLDARTGDTIATQSKRKHFVLTAEDVERWGFPPGHEGPIEEDLSPGHSLTVIESRIGRVCLLVCEDLAAAVRLGGLLDSVGASLVFAPVLSRPLKERRWEQQGADTLVNSIGLTVVVANSMVVGRSQGRTGTLGAAMVVRPGEASIREATGPEELMHFRLDPPLSSARYVAAA